MALTRRQESGCPPALSLLLAVVTLQAVPVSVESAVFRLWAADHQVTGPALAELPGGSAVLCALRCRLQSDCRSLQTSADQCRLLASWPQPDQLTSADNSTVMVQLSQPGACAEAEHPSAGGCLDGWQRVGGVCYRGISQTGDWALFYQEINFCTSLHPKATLATFDSTDEFAYLQGKTEEAFFLNLKRGMDGEFEMVGRCAGFWRAKWSDDQPQADDVYGYYNADYDQIRGRRVDQYVYRDYTLCQMIPGVTDQGAP